MANDKLGRQVSPRTPTDGRKVVAAAGTAEALVSTTTPVNWVIITAETNNTGVMTVGASTVVATVLTRRGTVLLAGESVLIEAVDLLNIYLDATVTGDGVTFLYVV